MEHDERSGLGFRYISGWKAWVEEAGAVFCVKQREMDERQTEDRCEAVEI